MAMDPEQTHLRVHARLSGMLSQLFTPVIRMPLEFMYFAFAIAIVALLFVMHVNFVQQVILIGNPPRWLGLTPGCASELSGVKFGEAQLVQIKITTAGLWTQNSSEQNSLEFQREHFKKNTGGPDVAADGSTILSTEFWSNWLGLGSTRSKLIFKSWKNDKELLVPVVGKTSDSAIIKTMEHETDSKTESPILQVGYPISLSEFIKQIEVKDFASKLQMQFFSLWKRGKEFLFSASNSWLKASSIIKLSPSRGGIHSLILLNPYGFFALEILSLCQPDILRRKAEQLSQYLYTTEKGYFLIPEVDKSYHNIQTVNITISAQSSCFGNRWQQLLISMFVGCDTILMNTLLSSPGHGYLYNYQTKEFYDLSYGQKAPDGPTRFGAILLQDRQEARQEAMRNLMTTTMIEGTPMRDHVLKMMDHLNDMEVLGAEINGENQVNIILQSLPKSFEQFHLNYNMNKRLYSLAELLIELQAGKGLFRQSVHAHIAQKVSTSNPKGKKRKKQGKAKKEAGPQAGVKKPKGKRFTCKQTRHWKEDCPNRKQNKEYLVTKCGALIMSLFVFFTTTMSVSFTLRETQSRMLRFIVQLQHHAHNHLPTFQLIFVHVIESLVFVPIMIGILFFLFEFYDDQLLAILVLTLVWLCELFTMISVRTTISMQFFPRFFLLYFLVFHIYFFSYPYGFSYVAFSAMLAFMQHLILYFWNRFEVPALQSFMRTRAQLQQQTGVQITSSAIYTSTFHIARVSISNRNALGNEPTTATTEISARSDQTGESNTPFANNEPPEVLNINPHQRILQRPTNSLGSLLLSLLGGACSESIFSFFSVSGDSQNQGQAHQEQTPQEN